MLFSGMAVVFWLLWCAVSTEREVESTPAGPVGGETGSEGGCLLCSKPRPASESRSAERKDGSLEGKWLRRWSVCKELKDCRRWKGFAPPVVAVK